MSTYEELNSISAAEIKEFEILFDQAFELIKADFIGKTLLKIAQKGPLFKPKMFKENIVNPNLGLGCAGMVYRDESGDHCCLGPKGFRNTTSLNYNNPQNQNLNNSSQLNIADQINSPSEKIYRLAIVLLHELTHVRQYNRDPIFINDRTNKTRSPHLELIGAIIEADAYTEEALFSWRLFKNKEDLQFQSYPLLYHGVSSTQWDSFVDKIAFTQTRTETQNTARFLFATTMEAFYQKIQPQDQESSTSSFNNELTLKLLSLIYTPQTYGSPTEFSDCIPNLETKNKKNLQNLIKNNSNTRYGLIPVHREY